MMTVSITVGLLLLVFGIVIGGYLTLIVERQNADKARAEGYEAGLAAGKKTKKDKGESSSKAERRGYERGHADALAEVEDMIAERMSAEADALIAQGYEAGLEANLCEAELVMKAGK